jgi:hypothetical protein
MYLLLFFYLSAKESYRSAKTLSLAVAVLFDFCPCLSLCLFCLALFGVVFASRPKKVIALRRLFLWPLLCSLTSAPVSPCASFVSLCLVWRLPLGQRKLSLCEDSFFDRCFVFVFVLGFVFGFVFGLVFVDKSNLILFRQTMRPAILFLIGGTTGQGFISLCLVSLVLVSSWSWSWSWFWSWSWPWS